MPSRTRIKICGVCRPEDALLAAHYGADAIGMIFHPPSRRNVSVTRAREILAAIPPFVTAVGLFVDASAETIFQTTRELGLRYVQLNGVEPAAFIAALKPLTVVKAVRVERDRFEETLASWRKSIREFDLTNLAGLVLETAKSPLPGGSGVPNDWTTVHEARQSGAFDGLPSLIAAGGLMPETVGNIVRAIRPYSVDVSTGVEASLGCKSGEKLCAFVDAVRAADQALTSTV